MGRILHSILSCGSITTGCMKKKGICFSRNAPLFVTRMTVLWGLAFSGKAYGKITTLHWLKVQPQLEGLGLGRGLLSQVLGEAAREEFPIYLHTHPSCFRAIHLYQEFGFQLLEGPAVGNRSNDLEESLPYLRQAMPAAYFQNLQYRKTPEELLQAADGRPEEF